MLDPKILRENPEKIRNMLKDRAIEFDFDGLLKNDESLRKLMQSIDILRKMRNDIAHGISKVKKNEEIIESERKILETYKILELNLPNLLNAMNEVSNRLKPLEKQLPEIQSQLSRLKLTIPNLIDGEVPRGSDELANEKVREWGNIPKFDFKIQDHVDLSTKLELVDLERAAKVSGARFYYLKNDLVKLNQALINFALNFLTERDYSIIQPPYLINRKSMEGAVIAEDFEDVIYKVDKENLYLIGTSEHAIAAMHSDEIIDGKLLPMRYAGVSPCFRKEAGAHGKDQKGIFRVHQFEKVEQFVFSRPEESSKEHERLLETAEKFYQKLEIPYKVMLLSSGNMGKISAKTYDIEAWMAGQNAYREIVSCSNCLDYQARRLKIRFRDRTNDPTEYLHTLNSTLVATTRVLVAIMENFQTKDGHFRIPEVLQKYMNNQKII